MKLNEIAKKERSILSVMGKQPDPYDGYFFCCDNRLTSLQGAPSHVVGGFDCSDNYLESLEYAPSHVTGGFYCANNRLRSLQYVPNHVGGGFNCSDNLLTSLQGAPSHVTGGVDCDNNQLITNLKDIHKHIKFIGKNFVALQCPIKSHILGLLLIDGLQKVILDNEVCAGIINKHLGKGKRGMFDAQQEMIEAGFPEMAKL